MSTHGVRNLVVVCGYQVFQRNYSKQNQNSKQDGKVTKRDKQNKWEARGRIGIFAGYRMKNGYEWTKRYQVWDLDAFLDVNLAVEEIVGEKSVGTNATAGASKERSAIARVINMVVWRLNAPVKVIYICLQGTTVKKCDTDRSM